MTNPYVLAAIGLGALIVIEGIIGIVLYLSVAEKISRLLEVRAYDEPLGDE